MNDLIPASIDHLAILADLNRWGWLDAKIETYMGFSEGYVTKLKKGIVVQLRYDRAARLHNLWCDERPEFIQPLEATTT